MADKDMLKTVWDGQIPMCFLPDPKECVVSEEPGKLFLMMPRVSYLPFITDKVKEAFNRFIDPEFQEGPIWFEHNKKPLKMEIPVGVLHDLLQRDEDNLPWNVVAHFKNYPQNVLGNYGVIDALESYFLTSLKQAEILRYGDSIASVLPKEEKAHIWISVTKNDFRKYWTANKRVELAASRCLDEEAERLAETEGPSQGPSQLLSLNLNLSANESIIFRYIPIRFYEGTDTHVDRHISPLLENGTKKTVADLLKELSTDTKKVIGVRTHGILINQSTQLQWLSECLSFPDSFLHLVVLYEKQN